MIGSWIGHYRIVEKLGEGGMGVVYKARDTHLDRFVAIKVMPPGKTADPDLKARFVQEAKAASALNHPNIVTIYDIDRADGIDFIAMEYIDGGPLSQLIPPSGLPIDTALHTASQVAASLAAAHNAGIVHRDIKPANIMVTASGGVKILDFGLAKLTHAFSLDTVASTMSLTQATQVGALVGTFAYMSPEQAEGKVVDAKSDVFSFAVVLYEMLTGRNPFRSDSSLSTLTAILNRTPDPLRKLRPDVPPACEQIVARCLDKRPELRPSLEEVSSDLAACTAARAASGLHALLRRPLIATLILIAFSIPIAWFAVRSWRVRWARNIALPEIVRLIEKQRLLPALRLARQAEQYLPYDPQVARLRDMTGELAFRSIPSGAELYIRDYEQGDPPSEWTPLGTTPLDNIRLAYGFYRYRITKTDYASTEGAFLFDNARAGMRTFRLYPAATAPADMVWVSGGGSLTSPATPPAPLRDFWLDRYEVTNRQFKEFVNRGGYQNPRFWKHPFVRAGRTLTWEQAMADFRDSTGRNGPATWELGSFPEGQADYPVGGISWYEAAAYAEFAGKSLPTVYHWMHAAVSEQVPMARLSNFLSKGPVPVGASQGISTGGSYDLAGNVKEWAWNHAGNRRYSLGGSWEEASYLFLLPDARDPFDRPSTQGFRCARYLEPPDSSFLGSVEFVKRDRTGEKPVGDEIFQTFRNLHSYDKTELKSSIESVTADSEHWRREKVTFLAAYADERVIAYLFLPRNASAPFQTVIYFAGAQALLAASSATLDLPIIEFLVRSGRAVIYPIYKGTYERGPGAYYHRLGKPNLWRDMNIQWSKDLGRSVDYMETRADLDREKLAFFGVSLGAAQGPRLVAVEPRIKTAILLQGGFYEKVPAEVDPLNFAPRVRVPVLMLNGRDDFLFPLQTSQLPLFRLLGTAPEDKRHVLFNGGHNIFGLPVIREILDWLDRYLGSVNTSHAGG